MEGHHMIRTLVLAAVVSLSLVARSNAADKLTVLLDWFVNPDHGPLIVAKEGGYFDRVGLDVELVAPADPSAPPKLVAAGQADVAITYQPDMMLHLKAGLPLVRFGTLVETPLNSLIVLKDGPVKSLADLKGKRIGYSISGFEDVYVSVLLESVGLKTSDVTLIDVNFNLTSSLLAGQVDAVIGGYRNFELTQLGLEGKEGHAFFPEENGVPPYDELIYVTRTEQKDDPRLGRFLDAVEAATIFLTNHPQAALDMFLKAHPDLNDELNRRAWFDTLPRFAKRPAAIDERRYDRFAAFLKGEGLIDDVPPFDTYNVMLK
jgi:putative hydroxymethylpyrimidine transport system substrate-binding protein